MLPPPSQQLPPHKPMLPDKLPDKRRSSANKPTPAPAAPAAPAATAAERGVRAAGSGVRARCEGGDR